MPERFTGGFFQTNGYLLKTPGDSYILVDAPMGVAAWLRAKNIVPAALLLTHQHIDHIDDASEVAAMGVKVHAFSPHSAELTLETLLQNLGMQVRVQPFTVDEVLEGRKSLEIDGLRIDLAHVPGHSADSVTFFLPDQGELFSGDTLMASGLGRSDFPGGDGRLLIDGIREKLLALPLDTKVFPGHGPATTIGAERAGNPYCGD
ncbi:MBL fold metallo-hydrolase [Luteolibacter flavescens]|uniref:MBL fold metallo-hydrolase n=1 Tax=Luteolibacter flavescens TaxID=1859460 RepID=A0ABT3FT59_9BACT|nr:MBL fold metallo-hydrolase [Luteolibacter flavescens]MCW1886499.1 MBL fold metallo-hydrolase [Luteolibacter flavescens]